MKQTFGDACPVMAGQQPTASSLSKHSFGERYPVLAGVIASAASVSPAAAMTNPFGMGAWPIHFLPGFCLSTPLATHAPPVAPLPSPMLPLLVPLHPLLVSPGTATDGSTIFPCTPADVVKVRQQMMPSQCTASHGMVRACAGSATFTPSCWACQYPLASRPSLLTQTRLHRGTPGEVFPLPVTLFLPLVFPSSSWLSADRRAPNHLPPLSSRPRGRLLQRKGPRFC